MSAGERTSLIIPAYNEAARIGPVIEAGLNSPGIVEIIVVDDGSSDNTSDIANDYPVTLLRHNVNMGKGEAMQTGFQVAKEFGSTSLLFLDADLHNLKPVHIQELTDPVINHTATMTIGILERTSLQKAVLRRWGAFSGQRAMPIPIWERLTRYDKHGFNVEAALNARSRQDGTHRGIRKIELSGVTHTGQREKEPTLGKAALAYSKRYGSAILTYTRIALSESH